MQYLAILILFCFSLILPFSSDASNTPDIQKMLESYGKPDLLLKCKTTGRTGYNTKAGIGFVKNFSPPVSDTVIKIFKREKKLYFFAKWGQGQNIGHIRHRKILDIVADNSIAIGAALHEKYRNYYHKGERNKKRAEEIVAVASLWINKDSMIAKYSTNSEIMLTSTLRLACTRPIN